jgi:hypothetical protein
MPVMPIFAWKPGGALHRVLAGERVRDVQHLGRLGDGALLGELGHQRVVDVQPARAVDDQRVVADGARLGERLSQQLARRGELGMEDRHLGRSADRAQLLARGRALHVGRHQQRVAPAALQPASELGRRGGLARALQARHQDHARQLRRERERARLGAAQHLDHLVPHDAQHRLVRGQALQDLLAHRAGPHALDELLGDAEVDVGFEQREADLAQRASTWASPRTPCPRRVLNTPWSLSLSASNTADHPRPGHAQAKAKLDLIGPSRRRQTLPDYGYSRAASVLLGRLSPSW